MHSENPVEIEDLDPFLKGERHVALRTLTEGVERKGIGSRQKGLKQRHQILVLLDFQRLRVLLFVFEQGLDVYPGDPQVFQVGQLYLRRFLRSRA